jgi:uroporphyrinogen III methyltransferase/synthase
VVGELRDIVEKLEEAGITAPAVTIVGDVVRMRESIAWFEKKPLFGKRIIVTRAESSAAKLTAQLEELAAQVDEFPVIKFAPPPDCSELDGAIANLASFDWIVFTSANGVEWFVKRLLDMGRDIRALGCARLAAIGPKTARALEALKLRVDYVPSEYVAEAVIAEFPEDPAGKKILIPRALEAREELPLGLRDRGADVTVVAAYETVVDESSETPLRKRLAEEPVDVITFTSASTVHNFFRLAGEPVLPESVTAACIGPITAEAARAHGLKNVVMAAEYTIEGLVEALL